MTEFLRIILQMGCFVGAATGGLPMFNQLVTKKLDWDSTNIAALMVWSTIVLGLIRIGIALS